MGSKLIGIILSLIKYALIAYVIIVAATFVFQRHLLYFPNGKAFDVMSFGVRTPFEAIAVPVEGGQTVTSWYKPAEDLHKPTIVFMHGNAADFSLRAYRIEPLLAAGYGVALVGYPGFEGNSGDPTEASIYQSARGVIVALGKRGIMPDRIILHGESLGTCVAVQMAAEFPVAAVSLEAPPASMAAVGAHHYSLIPVRFLLKDRYDSIGKIKLVKAPLFVIHGTGDTVVPFEQGKALFEAANEPKEALFIPGANHNDGLYTEETKERLLQFYSRFIQK